MDTTRSDKIKAGLQRSFRSGKSAKASIVCYGYKVDSKGKLEIYSMDIIQSNLQKGIVGFASEKIEFFPFERSGGINHESKNIPKTAASTALSFAVG